MKKHILALSLMVIMGTFSTACTDKKQTSSSTQAENKQHDDHAEADHAAENAVENAAEHDHAEHKEAEHAHDEKVGHIGAHVHGEAELKVVLSGKDLVIDLDSPAMNVFGFEHNPNTDEQKATVAKKEKLLGDAAALFGIKGGDCSLKEADVDMPFDEDNAELDAHKHADDEHKHDDHQDDDKHGHDDHEHDGEIHSDVEATYNYECQAPEKLTEIQVKLFDTFKGFDKLNAEWVAGDKQGAQTLTKGSQKLLLK